MRSCIFTLIFVSFFTVSFGQTTDGLIELGKLYRQFMLRSNPPESVINDFTKYENSELAFTAKFIKETLSPGNNLLTADFLNRPDDKDLKLIYIVRHVNYNVRKENPEDNAALVKELTDDKITSNELVDAYYEMLFSGVGNKLNPYDLSAVNFELNKYNLKDDTEKGIFFLKSMALNGSMIWGYINIAKPPRYEEALKFISKYPRYNGSLYYQYLDFGFPDFELKLTTDGKKESFKKYYINKFYETLLNHLLSLKQTGAEEEKIRDITLGSILKERSYYKYSKNKDLLEKLFVVQKQ